MVIICWNRRVTRRSQACLTFSLFMERRWVKIKMRKRKLISSPGRHWEILEDSGWINHDVCEPVLKRSQWWDSDHRLENLRRRRRRRFFRVMMLWEGLRSFIAFKHNSKHINLGAIKFLNLSDILGHTSLFCWEMMRFMTRYHRKSKLLIF